MSERELPRTPGAFGLMARAGAGTLPVSLPGLTGRRAADVAATALVVHNVRTELPRLAAFSHLCGYTLGNSVPAAWPHILAFPLQLSLLTDPSFPFPAIGMVHIYNRITQHRPIALGEALSLKVWAEPLRDHPRGRAVPVRTEARVGDELVWEELAINLRIGKRDESATAGFEVPSSEGYPQAALWRLPGDIGRRYAAVAGDYNPIHLHPLSARAFGFPRAIAHGFYSKARALAMLAPRLPGAFTAEVAFKRPVLLPASVSYVQGIAPADGTVGFGVRDARKDIPHLDGRVSY